MLSFSQFLAEGYKNFIGVESTAEREKWADRVWAILQSSYAPVGGIRGSGFGSKREMIEKIPFWKIFARGERVLAAVLYKDKSGRKSVAVATDGSDEGKRVLANICGADLKRSYGEKSGPALGFMLKTVGDLAASFLLAPAEVSRLTGDECIPVDQFTGELDPADKRTLEKFPHLRGFFYVRRIGGEWHMKATLGTSGLTVQRR